MISISSRKEITLDEAKRLQYFFAEDGDGRFYICQSRLSSASHIVFDGSQINGTGGWVFSHKSEVQMFTGEINIKI